MMKNKEHILYVGGYLNEGIVNQRGLPSRNSAGSNRMHRIANALKSSGRRIIIASPGVSMKIAFKNFFFYPATITKTGKAPVFFNSTIGSPFLGMVYTFFSMPFSLFFLHKRKKFSSVIIYNFSPMLVIIAFVFKFFFRVPVFQNIEDISYPKISDWSRKTEVRPFQQIIFFCCLRLISAISSGYIIPTRKFIKFLNKKKPCIIVTGCINIKPNNLIFHNGNNDSINILFSGKIEFAHGIDKFIEAMLILDKSVKINAKVKVDISGYGSKAEWLKYKLQKFKNLNINYHGFIPDSSYENILNSANICIALQDPKGRYSNNKTPSKVYEYLGYHKTVIATDVGDLAILPEEIITICKPFNEKILSKLILYFINNKSISDKQALKAGKYAYKNYSYNKVGKDLSTFICEQER